MNRPGQDATILCVVVVCAVHNTALGLTHAFPLRTLYVQDRLDYISRFVHIVAQHLTLTLMLHLFRTKLQYIQV